MNVKIITLWHPVDRMWRKIIQHIYEDGHVRYFTDGEETVPDIAPPKPQAGELTE